ncbi:mRNA (guanine-N(7))-methyltransferase [Trifolium repens]|nr:mRNA (guanine-N(7))-methyltransferase [Trifolium repens]
MERVAEEEEVRVRNEAEGLTFGNSVYWIWFDEEYSDKKFKASDPFGIKYTFHLEMMNNDDINEDMHDFEDEEYDTF